MNVNLLLINENYFSVITSEVPLRDNQGNCSLYKRGLVTSAMSTGKNGSLTHYFS